MSSGHLRKHEQFRSRFLRNQRDLVVYTPPGYAEQVYAYDLGMITLGVSGLMLCYTLFRAKLVPGALAIWGLVGYAVLFFGMLSDVMGSGLGLASSIPGGLWEAAIGVWLIAKGFSASGLTRLATRASQIANPR